MAKIKKEITVTVKLFTGLNQFAKIDTLKALEGFPLQIPEKTRVISVIRTLNLTREFNLRCFINGQRAGFLTMIKDKDQISFFKPASGG